MDIRLGMHADNWRGQSKSFNDAVASAVKYNLKYLEAGTVYGYYFVSSLGYDPSLSILDNPYPIKRLLDKHGLSLSMLDASYPIFGPQGAYYGIPYYTQVIRYAKELGAPKVDSVDSGQAPDMPRDPRTAQLRRGAFQCRNHHPRHPRGSGRLQPMELRESR